MEPIFLTIMVIAFLVTKGKVDSAAYANGKEPAGVAKARLRHEVGGGGRTAKGRPKGPGAFRLFAATRWADACEAARQRSEHNAARRRQWYRETAPQRDERWRSRRLRRLDKADAARQRWADARGLIDPNKYRLDRRQEEEAWRENAHRDAGGSTDRERTPKAEPRIGTAPEHEPVAPCNREPAPDDAERPNPEDSPETDPQTLHTDKDASEPAVEPTSPEETTLSPPAVSTSTKGTNSMYLQAVQDLNASADEIAEFRSQLKAFADDLAGKKWGVQVTGVIQDMHTRLNKIEGEYRDLAGRVKHQGDQGAAAYDQAPYVPGADAVMA